MLRSDPVPQERPTPCEPSPCGANAICREQNGAGSCSCISEYIGNPYEGCRPECVINTDCPTNKACMRNKCQDPCPGTCGQNAECQVVNHLPSCNCFPGYTGDPFRYCNIIPQQPPPPVIESAPPPQNPCIPSPCGPYSQCRDAGGVPSCTCLPEYTGAPPNCRPECSINPDCSSNMACMKEKCRDPCPGSCGANALCNVFSDPYRGCRPECVLNTDCPRDKACQRNKCKDPCPGTCGQGARCEVLNHIPMCVCPPGTTGNAFIECRPIPAAELPPAPPTNPCIPSPCGPNAQCKVAGESPSCSCLPDFLGAPPNCRPECISNSECSSHLACINQKCKDPCPGLCATNAICRVVSHTPQCLCTEGYTGDPFSQCFPKQSDPVPQERPTPCEPSPCGANAICREQNGAGSCSCISEYIGNPYEGCRPECVINTDCPTNKACMRNKCQDPCPGTCGQNAECQVVNHLPSCNCFPGYTGDPFRYCNIIPQQPPPPVIESAPPPQNPCIPSPCGPYSQCRDAGGVPSCTCLPEYTGAPPNCRPECSINPDCSSNMACMKEKCRDPCPGSCGANALCNVFSDPYRGCRPECVLNTDCPRDKACQRNKCKDPCPGTCGQGARCEVLNHIPMCVCPPGTTGNAFIECRPIPAAELPPAPPTNPCIPSPCGPNAQCKVAGESPSCSCLPDFLGAPPNCRPECISNSECSSHLACINQKCKDPCPGLCATNAICRVVSHTPQCLCTEGYTGDPFSQCFPKQSDPVPQERPTPCEPSPCGANAICREQNGAGSCSCISEYIGNPYEGCRPECVINTDCPTNKACMRNKCQDPCPGTCGQNAECQVVNHLPSCNCFPGYTGDPFRYCNIIPQQRDPYRGCRPECVLNTDCPRDKACQRNKCKDPCPGTCGQGARCEVLNHIPMCVCPPGTTGNAFIECRPIPAAELPPAPPTNPCIPSPCGPNAQCKVAGESPSCSCLPDFLGAPPNCRPECISNSECSSHLACINQKCKDPCPGLCATNAICRVVSHTPQCLCTEGYTGDPFSQCFPKQSDPVPQERPTPCEPSPCGANAICREQMELAPVRAYQNTLETRMKGADPNVLINTDCPTNKACMRNKCQDPCPGTCGQNAECQVVNHLPSCNCFPGYTGDPFRYCNIIPQQHPPPVIESAPPPQNPMHSFSLWDHILSVEMPEVYRPARAYQEYNRSSTKLSPRMFYQSRLF
ncbi:hypothetical protein GE061_002221 [Apolygus lucorum]|uniref:EGF-like domain-containing protein n=1 Tax=Apolygus lucorum TaxID=248454 RepID=A0A8S9X738_APOLU|nr:hypothetical protein GE061_002221 [Apolygus lucorum]